MVEVLPNHQPLTTNHHFLYLRSMFQRLKEKWGVSGLDLALILITFAIGGSLCGYLAEVLLIRTPLKGGVVWVIMYILLVTALWPVCVVFISLFTGQYTFFKKYVGKMASRIFGRKK